MRSMSQTLDCQNEFEEYINQNKHNQFHSFESFKFQASYIELSQVWFGSSVSQSTAQYIALCMRNAFDTVKLSTVF